MSRHITSAKILSQQFPNSFSKQHAAVFECVLYPWTSNMNNEQLHQWNEFWKHHHSDNKGRLQQPIFIFLNVAPCSLAERIKHVGGKCCINLPTWRWRQQSDTLPIYQSIRCHILEDLNVKDLQIVISERNEKTRDMELYPTHRWTSRCKTGADVCTRFKTE